MAQAVTRLTIYGRRGSFLSGALNMKRRSFNTQSRAGGDKPIYVAQRDPNAATEIYELVTRDKASIFPAEFFGDLVELMEKQAGYI